jgi:hypothetical protein
MQLFGLSATFSRHEHHIWAPEKAAYRLPGSMRMEILGQLHLKERTCLKAQGVRVDDQAGWAP